MHDECDDECEDDPAVKAELDKIEAEEEVTEEDAVNESGDRLRWVKAAVEFCEKFTPGPVDNDHDVHSLDDLLCPMVREKRDLALLSAFGMIADQFDSLRKPPPKTPPFVLDCSKIGRG